MRTFFSILILLGALACSVVRGANTQVEFILPPAAKAGDTVLVGVQMKMASGWHTYWKNPGEAGQATAIKWTLPAGVTAGDIEWPLPHKIPPADVVTYGYEDEVVLLVPLKIEASVAGQVNLKAKVLWLECKESCIPADAEISGAFNVGEAAGSTADNPNEKTIAAWLAKVPVTDKNFSAQAFWESTTNKDTRNLILRWSGKPDGADFFPDANDDYAVQGAAEIIPINDGAVELRMTVKKFSGDWPKEISGVIVNGTGDARHGFEVKLSVAEETAAAPKNAQPLWLMLLYAFIGGLILNVMPCVLPVIALKILGFVGEARSNPRRVRALGLVYALGVLVSFLALAAVVIGVKAAGQKAGWGMQFGNPVFIVCLTTLVTLVTLNLFGVFEVILGGRAISAAGELASRHGMAGAFFNGVLATALATPCTAPFLAPALGFAFLQSTGIILLVFATISLGLSAPYVVLSWHPAWLKFLPKPGAWMEKFKIAMGFPMLLTVVWLLLEVATGTYGDRTVWLGVFLAVVALTAWIYGEFIQRGGKGKGIARGVVVLLLVANIGFVLEGQLEWRHPPAPNQAVAETSAAGITWQPWSPEAVAQARAAGRPVLVDFTANWCLTCQVNKKTSIEIPSVAAKLKEMNAVALVGDYTRTPDNITTELNRFNRAGVPLVLVYSKDPNQEPRLLPAVLTPGVVLDALNWAAH